MLKLIVTWADDEHIGFLVEWLASLSHFGKYDDEIVIVDYGLSTHIINSVKDSNSKISFYKGENKCAITTNSKFIDALSVVEKYPDYKIAIFDLDIWFQDNINPLFDYNNSNGCLFSIEEALYRVGRGTWTDKIDVMESIRNIFDKLYKIYGGNINAGFIFGEFMPLKNKLEHLKKLLENSLSSDIFGAEQWFLNEIFDFENDDASGHKWNCLAYDTKLKNDIFYVKNTNEKAVGIHCNRKILRGRKSMEKCLFRHKYYDIFKNFSWKLKIDPAWAFQKISDINREAYPDKPKMKFTTRKYDNPFYLPKYR